MTTGSKSQAYGTTYLPGFNGSLYPASYGVASSKTWSGVDRPKTPVTRVYRSIPQDKIVKWCYKGRDYTKVVLRSKAWLTSFRNPQPIQRDAPHPYTMSCARTTEDPYFSYQKSDGKYLGFSQQNTNTGDALRFLTPVPSWTSNHDANLIGKLREGMNGSDFHAGIALGEGREALSMIRTAAGKISAAMLLAKRGRMHEAAAALSDHRYIQNGRKPRFTAKDGKFTLSGNWLELQYGWLPLLHDVYSGAQFLAHHLEVPRVARYTSQVTLRGVPDVAVTPGRTVFLVNESFNRKRLIAYITERNVAKMSGLTDPLSVAWELLPYSFVADWFLPVGNFLSARGFSSAIEGTFVTTYSERREGKAWVRGNNPNTTYVGGKGGSYLSLTVNRTVSSSLIVPPPVFKPLSEVVGWRHAVNAVALLTQRFGSR